jgi:SAM-dependent methyltransferase
MATSGIWQSGAGYEGYVGRWSRLVATTFIERLGVPGGARWIDVGCGTGAVTETVLARAEPASVVGVDPSEMFIGYAREHVTDQRARFEIGDGAALPLPDHTADAAISGLVLNFVPDPVAMLAEMRRVTRPDGRVGIYVWDYAEGMAIMRHFWDAAIEQDPAVADKAESLQFAICRPEPLHDAFEWVGLREVDVEAVDIPTVFRDFDDYWQPFLMATAPAPRHVMSLSAADREDLRRRLQARLPTEPDGSIHLVARAWGVTSSV